jgi:FMN phosphatase YigB (HAD superfamily)
MELCERLILTDIDGCVLSWETAFDEWMQARGHRKVANGDQVYKIGTRYDIDQDHGYKLVRQFNNSSWIGFLSPFRDAVYYMDLLYRRHGYRFHAITSLSRDPYSQKLREQNLHRFFGEEMFVKIECLDTGADKDAALAPYRDSECVWVEDNIKNAQLGRDLGLRTFLMEHSHNSTRCPDGVRKVTNWQQIYRAITGQD